MARKKDAPLDLRTSLAKARGGTTKEYRKKQIIFPQGSPADAVFYIEKGKVKLTVLSTRGKEAVVAILGNGDFFGEGSLAGQPLRMATATAMTECSILRVQKETMAEMVGTTRSRVSFFMNKFRKVGFIDYNGGLQVHSSLMNIILHD